MHKILLLDQDTSARELLCMALHEAGYEVRTADDGIAGLALARQERPDLVLVNLQLPRLNGYSVCGILREESTVPIIVLSSRHEEHSCIASFEVGANDFVTIPCSRLELLARVRTLLRWHHLTPQQPARDPARPRYLSAAALLVDLASRRVWRDQHEIELAPKEFDLLVYLMQRNEVVLSRDQLLHAVWGADAPAQPRTVDVHIHTLRVKIEVAPALPRFIQTVRGAGYRFHTPTQPAQQRAHKKRTVSARAAPPSLP